MLKTSPFNILICGIGGQGVFTLTKIIRLLAEQYGLNCQGSTFKGGAQQLGSIFSTLRLFNSNELNYSFYSSEISEGDLDLQLSLEPWETLRYQKYWGDKTEVLFNTQISPPLQNRYLDKQLNNPIDLVLQHKPLAVAQNYTQIAIEKYGSSKMLNYEVGLAAIKNKKLPFLEADYQNIFELLFPKTQTKECL